MEGKEKDFQCKWKRKKAAVAVHLTDKTDFKTKTVIKRQSRVLHNAIQVNLMGYNIHKYSPPIGGT